MKDLKDYVANAKLISRFNGPLVAVLGLMTVMFAAMETGMARLLGVLLGLGMVAMGWRSFKWGGKQ